MIRIGRYLHELAAATLPNLLVLALLLLYAIAS